MADEEETKEEPATEIVPTPVEDGTPTASTPGTRRGLLRWIAPVALFVGSTLKPSTAQANSDDFSPGTTGPCVPR